MLYLIRHGPVLVEPERPAPEWQLSAAGQRLAHELAGALTWQGLERLLVSPEPKARATADPIARASGLELTIEPALAEVRRGAGPFESDEDYRARVRAFFAAPNEPPHGWESSSSAQRRFSAVLDPWAASTARAAAVSHGLGLTVYAAGLGGAAVPRFEEWEQIPLPAVAIVDRGRLIRPFVSVPEFLRSTACGRAE